ncbi:MAG TPA: DUF92 domain-containing protein [Candidatus Diapherotrites archaeon]|jgi:uncharacterized protein (TIGR00297 family)|nr:DUF92 domain-containing protein [Candidatus Diapherotrites archaeon]
MSILFIYVIIFLIIGIILHFTRKYDLLTIAIAYIVLGAFLYFTNISVVIYVGIFFILAELITMATDKKHEKRTYKNILGNTISGIFFLIIGGVISLINPINKQTFIIAAIASISCAFSDTLSSEIGVLSKKQPRLITNLKKEVNAGTSGGITLLGTVGGIIGAGITALLFWIFKYDYKTILIISICGIIGTIIDSIIGATIENKEYINNNQTNILATFITGIIALLLI